MNIEGRIAQVRSLLDRLHSYERLIDADNFEASTIDDMKGNAKDVCDAVKIEIDGIKAEIDQWS